VFQNLVSNAINYGRQGGVVGLSARSAGDGRRTSLVVTVRDQGEGIAREHLPRLTERFYRVDPARSRAVGGTGLGLAIVKHIVSRHRGRLEIDSEVGRGSVFTVFLPAAPGGKPSGRGLHKTVTELS
jgi:two-component system phosphate regulon sensor histidine kinase PhoR